MQDRAGVGLPSMADPRFSDLEADPGHRQPSPGKGNILPRKTAEASESLPPPALCEPVAACADLRDDMSKDQPSCPNC